MPEVLTPAQKAKEVAERLRKEKANGVKGNPEEGGVPVPEAKVKGNGKSLNDILKEVVSSNKTLSRSVDMHEKISNTPNTVSDDDNAATINELIRNAMVLTDDQNDPRNVCSTFYLNGLSGKAPVIDDDNLNVFWLNDAAKPVGSIVVNGNPFELNPILGTIKLSKGLIAGADYDLTSMLVDMIRQEMFTKYWEAIFQGTANISMKGILGSIPVNNIIDATGNAVVPDQLVKLFHKLKTVNRLSGSWAVPNDIAEKLATIKDAAGHYLYIPDFTTGSAELLMNKPVIYVDGIATSVVATKTVTQMLFGNFKRYGLFEHNLVDVVFDPFTSAKDDLVEITITRRATGLPFQASAFAQLRNIEIAA